MKTSNEKIAFIVKQWMRRIRVTSLLAILTFAAQFSNAEVIYTDIIPDTTISAIGGYYDLDLNNDGVPDYKFSRSGYGDFNSVDILRLHDSCFISYYNLDGCNFANAYVLNELIGNSDPWFTENYGVNIANYGGITYCMHGGAFPGQTDLYLGLKLIKNGITYFGWVRIDVAIDATWFTLKDYAYDSNPIIAGDGITMVNNLALDKNVAIYPNPTKGNFLILFEKSEPINIEITDIRGQIVLREKIVGSGFIDLSGYPDGMYFIKCIGNSLNCIQKIIKFGR